MRPSDPPGSVLATLAIVGQLGLVMVASVALGLLAGLGLDRWAGTTPLFTVLLLLAGVAGGMISAYRLAMQAMRGNEPGAPRETP